MYMVFLFYFCLNKFLPYIIVVLFPFSHWKQGIVELTAFSSLLASWFVNRQIAVPPVGLSAWRSFVFRCSISKIFTPDFTVIHTSLECTWYLYIIGFYALIISLPYYCSIRFLLSSSGWRLFRLWWCHASSLRRLVVPLVAAGLWAWWSPVFGARLAWYLHSFTVTLTSLQCACCVVKLLYYARVISLQYYYRIIFLFSLKAGGRRFDGAGGTVSCQ